MVKVLDMATMISMMTRLLAMTTMALHGGTDATAISTNADYGNLNNTTTTMTRRCKYGSFTLFVIPHTASIEP